ncbi:hypothetical protein Q8G01_27455, partial [Klebsiella pneumoniae]
LYSVSILVVTLVNSLSRGNYIGISWRYQQPQAVKISANLVEVTPLCKREQYSEHPLIYPSCNNDFSVCNYFQQFNGRV